MTIGIGWSLDDDHDFDTLMVTLLIGSVILFLLSLSTTVQPADPTLLGIQDEQSPLLPDYYKPYSLFKEHLSHISEEDPSLLQRMATNQSKPLPRPTSLLIWDDHLPPSFELARLPYPPPQAPAIVLITLMPGYTHCPEINHSKWMVRSFVSSIFCLGMAYGMTQPLLYLYLHDTLGFPMHTLGLMGCMTIMADYLAHYLVIHDGHLPVMVVMAHLILTVCTLSYTQLQPGGAFSTQLWAIVLQSLFGHERMMLKGTMAACYSSLGPTLGLLLTGYLVHGSYFYAALLSLISGILSWSYL
ncbi:hypothetical protein EDC96DRAFT_439707 [Choanephora cucurbitarum]|nr:hypothetical protein EDC96DRAFT_439707 [Choanephora cucurbitarum]